MGGAHGHLGLVIVGRHLGQRDRPVEERGTGDLAIGGQRLELVCLEARRRTGPMGRRATDRLDDPGRQIREILRDAPGAAGRARIEPGHLAEGLPFVVVIILVFQVRAGLEHNTGNACLGQLVGKGTTTGA